MGTEKPPRNARLRGGRRDLAVTSGEIYRHIL